MQGIPIPCPENHRLSLTLRQVFTLAVANTLRDLRVLLRFENISGISRKGDLVHERFYASVRAMRTYMEANFQSLVEAP